MGLPAFLLCGCIRVYLISLRGIMYSAALISSNTLKVGTVSLVTKALGAFLCFCGDLCLSRSESWIPILPPRESSHIGS